MKNSILLININERMSAILFLVSSFNIKLIEKKTSLLNPSLEFHGLWVLKINLCLEDSSNIASLFFFLSSFFFHFPLFAFI